MPKASYVTGEEVAAREGQSPRDTLSMNLLVVCVCVCLLISNRC